MPQINTYYQHEHDAKSLRSKAQSVEISLKQECTQFLDTEHDHTISQDSIREQISKAKDDNSKLEGPLQRAWADKTFFATEPATIAAIRSRLRNHKQPVAAQKEDIKRLEEYEGQRHAASSAYNRVKRDRERLESQSSTLEKKHAENKRHFETTRRSHMDKKGILKTRLKRYVHGAHYNANRAKVLRIKAGKKVEKGDLHDHIIEQTSKMLQGPKHRGKGPLWYIARDNSWLDSPPDPPNH